jgi:hypothetical protein
MTILLQIRQLTSLQITDGRNKKLENIELLQQTEAGHHASLQPTEQQKPRWVIGAV